MAFKRLSLIRGDTHSYGITFKNSAGVPLCIKNWVIKFTVKSNYDLSDAQASFQKIVTSFSNTTSGTTGSASVLILPADTQDLSVGEYDYDIVATTNENKTYTVQRGKLDLEWEVTRTEGTAGTA
jgi:DUF4097 and DUF4098 domain-containing protein YvlB